MSRPFTIHQLAGLVSNHLDPEGAAIVQRFGAKLVVISDLLKMFIQDSQIDPDGARWFLKEIVRSLRRLSSCLLIVASLHECPAQYRSLLLSLFDNQIHISSATKKPNRSQIQVGSNLLHNQQGVSGSSSSKNESSSFVITERGVKIIPAW